VAKEIMPSFYMDREDKPLKFPRNLVIF